MSTTTLTGIRNFGGPTNDDGLILRNGCCIDIDSESIVRAGPFGLYLELEKYFKTLPGVDPAYKLLRHETASNSYIYRSVGRDISAP